MICPHCKTGKLKQITKYPVQGTKHYIPGQVSIYKCLQCGQKERFFTSRETLYFGKLRRYGEYMKEDNTRRLTAESKLRDLSARYHTGHVRRQVENLQKILTSFLKSLP